MLCSVSVVLSFVLVLFNPSIQRACIFAFIDILTVLVVLHMEKTMDENN